MNAERIVAEFKEQFPGKNILQLPAENPSEIICEYEPTTDHPEYSVAVAAIDSSYPHVHRKSIETYEVARGEVTLFVGKESFDMIEGESYVIQPGIVHWATAKEAVVKVTSNPGWTPEDHILVHDIPQK